MEVQKCAAISNRIQLVLRIITDDRGSQCRFSTKFGAPREKWRTLLRAAKEHGLPVVGVSFHVGSGCRDAAKYELALEDARLVFDIARDEFGMELNLLDIGGGFPGETHSIWNPSETIDIMKEEDVPDEGKKADDSEDDVSDTPDRFMFFTGIAQAVAPIIDRLFPPEVRVIAEPGRYFVAACSTLCCSIVAARNNTLDTASHSPLDDAQAAKAFDDLTRDQEQEIVKKRAESIDQGPDDAADNGSHKRRSSSFSAGDGVLGAIQEELSDYTKLYANQQLVQQEFDVYNDKLDHYEEGIKTARDLLGPPEEDQIDKVHHTAEGMSVPLIDAAVNDSAPTEAFIGIAAAGEAAVNGMFLQAVVDSTAMQDDFAYYVNDGVYGAFNNLIFDHSTVRPRVLRRQERSTKEVARSDGLVELSCEDEDSSERSSEPREMFASTVFGPTCDSIDVISRSVLLPKLAIGDYMYFTNMGAYTMAAASCFNGFEQSPTFLVCSVPPDFFGYLVDGPSQQEIADGSDTSKF